MKDIYFDIVAVLELHENGLATSEMLAAELRSIRNHIGERLTAEARMEATKKAASILETAAALKA